MAGTRAACLEISQNPFCFMEHVPGSWYGCPGNPESLKDPCHLSLASLQSCVSCGSSLGTGNGAQGQGENVSGREPFSVQTNVPGQCVSLHLSPKVQFRGQAEAQTHPDCISFPPQGGAVATQPGPFLCWSVGTCCSRRAQDLPFPAVREQRGTGKKWEFCRIKLQLFIF